MLTFVKFFSYKINIDIQHGVSLLHTLQPTDGKKTLV